MIVGIDFDNTIANYAGVFHKVGVAEGWLPKSVGLTKIDVKKYLCDQKRERDWTRLQGLVYGSEIHKAKPYPDACHIISEMIDRGVDVFIISHKTQHPVLGSPHNLHQAAMKWLIHHGIVGEAAGKIATEKVFFNETQEEKIKCISILKCDFFIDDLPAIFNSPHFPKQTNGLHFNTSFSASTLYSATEVKSWQEIGCEFGIK